MNKRTYQDFLQTISRSPTEEECGYLADFMRPADVAEAEASGALEQTGSLRHYLYDAAQSSDAAVIVYEPDSQRKPLAIYGVCSFPEATGVGFVWMHGTEALGTTCKQDFLRLGRFGVAELTAAYRLLVCYADTRNTLHTRWLRWMGFTPINIQRFSDQRYPFLEFIQPGEQESLCVPR